MISHFISSTILIIIYFSITNAKLIIVYNLRISIIRQADGTMYQCPSHDEIVPLDRIRLDWYQVCKGRIMQFHYFEEQL